MSESATLECGSAFAHYYTTAIFFLSQTFMEPLSSGVYPIEMVNYVGERMPKFSRETSLMVKGSFDFIGLNYYTTKYATNIPCQNRNISYFTDSCLKLANEHDGIPIGPKTGSDWLYVYPRGIHDLLLYTKCKFNNPIIYITENGVSDLDLDMMLRRDTLRIDYYNAHLSFVRKAITEEVNVKGFFAWSLLDNFEWSDGYTVRFGIFFIDYEDGLKRYPKESSMWFKNFLYSRNQTLLKRSDIVDF